jgi:hypothetical protein
MFVRANVIAVLFAATCLPASALACVMEPLPPPLPNESPAEHSMRLKKEMEERTARYAAEQMAQKKQAEATWWKEAEAIVVFRVGDAYLEKLNAYYARSDAQYAGWRKRVKKMGTKAAGPPPVLIPMPPLPFDMFAKRDILLKPMEGVRSSGKPQTLKLWSQFVNTSCGPMHNGWLDGALDDDIAIGFFKDGASFTEKNLLGIRQRSEALDARTQAIFARYPGVKREERE